MSEHIPDVNASDPAQLLRKLVRCKHAMDKAANQSRYEQAEVEYQAAYRAVIAFADGETAMQAQEEDCKQAPPDGVAVSLAVEKLRQARVALQVGMPEYDARDVQEMLEEALELLALSDSASEKKSGS